MITFKIRNIKYIQIYLCKYQDVIDNHLSDNYEICELYCFSGFINYWNIYKSITFFSSYLHYESRGQSIFFNDIENVNVFFCYIYK